MTLTSISLGRLLFTALVLSLVAAIYVYWVRPRLQNQFADFYSLADGFWGRLWRWCKTRWDVAWAVVIAAFPILWNGVLDAAIAVSLLLADVLPAIAGLDLSTLVLPPWLKTMIQIGAAVLPAIRGAMLKRGES